MTLKKELTEKLKLLGLSPKRSLGQNFLINQHVIEKIINTVKEYQPKKIVEVGPGLGALTDELLPLSLNLDLVELDRGLAHYWRTKNLTVHEIDALKLDWSSLALPPGTLLVSNLPYQIASSLTIDRSIEPAGIDFMILMFQKEVAARITARPRSSSYGLLSVIAQTFWDLWPLVDVSPSSFYPAPKVASRVLVFKRKPLLNQQPLQQPASYLQFVKKSFGQRRKKLLSNLPEFQEKLRFHFANMNLSENIRAEELTFEQFMTLYGLLWPFS